MNGWQIQAVNAVGFASSEAAIISRDSPWTVVNVTTDSSNFGVQLPVTGVVFGDVVDVSLSSTFANGANVWFGSTVLNSSTTNADFITPGKSRFYRFVSAPLWNRYD